MTHPNVQALTEIVFSACVYNIETSWCSRTPHPYRIRCVQPRLLLAQIGFILLQYIISCLCVGILCFRYFKLLLLYRMYQSVGHSVCKCTNQIVLKLCQNFFTMELKCRYMALQKGVSSGHGSKSQQGQNFPISKGYLLSYADVSQNKISCNYSISPNHMHIYIYRYLINDLVTCSGFSHYFQFFEDILLQDQKFYIEEPKTVNPICSVVDVCHNRLIRKCHIWSTTFHQKISMLIN